MGQRNPAPVENGGKHPIFYRLSTIRLVVQDFFHTPYLHSGVLRLMLNRLEGRERSMAEAMLARREPGRGGKALQVLKRHPFH